MHPTAHRSKGVEYTLLPRVGVKVKIIDGVEVMRTFLSVKVKTNN